MITSLLDELDDKISEHNDQQERPTNNIDFKSPRNTNSNINEEPNDSIVQYVISYRKALDNLKEKNYLSAREQYKSCYELSKTKLKDNIKSIDCLINIAICDFYNGEFNLSISNLEQANKLYGSQENFATVLQKEHLGLKLYSNYAISNLTILKLNECIDNINSAISIIKREQNVKKQLSLTHSLIYSLFRLDSLVTINELTIADNYNSNKIISHIIKGFHQFLKDENFEHLIYSFKEASDRYKEIKDTNGFYYALFYQYVSQYNIAKNDNQINELKNKVSAVNKYIIGSDISGDVKEKDIETIMKDFRDKAKCTAKIFKILYDIENDLIAKNNKNAQIEEDPNLSKTLDKSHLFTNEKISSPIFITLLLRYSKNFLIEESESNPSVAVTNLLNELTLLESKIQQKEIDISKVKLNSFDPEITNALKQLFDNIILLYYREKLRGKFNTFVNISRQLSKREVADKLRSFCQANYQLIRTGSRLIKVNYTSSGTKSHYYKIDTLNETFQIRNKVTDKNPSSSFHLSDGIIKIVYGISTQNIKRKILSSGNREELILFEYPWRFMSFVTYQRSIDLYFDDEQLKCWFYGLKFYYDDSSIPYKMTSCNKFVLTMMKFKIVYKLRNAYQNGQLKEDNGLKDIVRDLAQEKGIQNFSFIKLFLLYNKLVSSE